MPAERLERIYEYFRNRPIEPKDFEELYVRDVRDILKEKGLI